MKNSIESCDRQKLRIPVLDKMRALLLLSEPKLLQRQLKASVLLGEHDRVTELTVRIKELFFSQAGGMFTFSKYPNLKPRNLFAKRYGVHNEHLKRSMLQWSNEPVHTSLTRLDGAGVDPAIFWWQGSKTFPFITSTKNQNLLVCHNCPCLDECKGNWNYY